MKRPLSIEEQIEYLKGNKNIVFSDMDKAKEYLYKYNYLNLISAYKYMFHNGKDDNDSHIYPEPIDFNEYIEIFEHNRLEEQKLLNLILDFERIVSSIISFEVLNTYKNLVEEECIEYNNVTFYSFLVNKYDLSDRTLSYFLKKLYGKNSVSPYIALNKTSFSNVHDLYLNMPKKIKLKIICKLNEENIFNNLDLQTLNNDFKYINGIRNALAHGNPFVVYHQSAYGKPRSVKEKVAVEKTLSRFVNIDIKI